MTLLDIKNLHTVEIKQVKEWCEQELEFRDAIGQEINQEKEATERLKTIRMYINNGMEVPSDLAKGNLVEGSFEHMVNQDHLKGE